MEERRKNYRKYLTFFSRVFDQKTRLLYGYLANLTKEGALLIGDKPLATDAVFHLRMDLPDEYNPRKNLDFDARVVWCAPAEEPEYYNAGLKLINVPDGDLEIIGYVLKHYGYPSDPDE